MCHMEGNIFALIGAAGYIAPRHMKAIADTGCELAAAVDRHDCVGMIDSYFPDARFFTEIERFDRYLEKRRRAPETEPVNYVSICSPNYLHDAHIRLALRVGADAICEKPLVVNPWNLDQLQALEQEYGRQVNTVLQLRLHPAIQKLKADRANRSDRPEILLTYVTRRGRWYDVSWKGDMERSGGVTMNIGIHFFDMLQWIFGAPEKSTVHLREPRRYGGVLELERARVRWFLSVDAEDLPQSVREAGGYAHRSLKIDGEEVDFSHGFTELHTEVYRQILAGNGFSVADARPSIETVYGIRTTELSAITPDAHPLVRS